MRVGVLTHYDVLNQGAQLQMYALCKEIERMGHSPEVITYEKNFDFSKEEKLKNQVSIRSIPYYISEYLIKKGVGLTVHNAVKYWKLKDFRKKNFYFSDVSSTDYDCVLVGSDEVFSIPVGFNSVMFGFGVKRKILASYAPSFGQTDIARVEQYHCREKMAEGLITFDYLSARDIHTQEMIREISDRDSQKVCDPVLLYDFTLEKNKAKTLKDRFLVVYSYDRFMNDEQEIGAIQAFARKNRLKTVSIGTYHKWCDINVACDPLAWMDWFRNAEFIITDTFHGTVVSIVCRKHFCVYIRDAINMNKIGGLLYDTGMEDRRIDAIQSELLEEYYLKETVYDTADGKIKELREQSRKYLQTVLGGH